MKKTILGALLLVPIFTQTMEKNFKIDEANLSHIHNFTLGMLEHCQQKCSFSKDVLQKCTSNCFDDYSKQYENFLTRKYTARCQELPFKEQWLYKENITDITKDLSNTIKARSSWENRAIQTCAQSSLAEINRAAQSQLRIKKSELKEQKEKHPVIALTTKALNKLRRID